MDVDEYFRKRANQVNEMVPMYDLLRAYNIPVRSEGEREEQFPCPLHGDGRDKQSSARYYPESNSMYCFACQKARDPIQWVRDYDGLDFMEAVKFLESKYGIEPPSPPTSGFDEEDYTDDNPLKTFMEDLEKEDDQSLADRMFEEADKSLTKLTQDRVFDNPQAPARLFFFLDSAQYDWENGRIDEKKAISLLLKLEMKVESLLDDETDVETS